jgi:hypothetical protein
MKRELLMLIVPIIVFVVLILSSKVMRTMIREAVLRPKEPCNIHVSKDKGIVVAHGERDSKEA